MAPKECPSLIFTCLLVNVYFPPANVVEPEYRNFLSDICRQYSSVILCGNFNAHGHLLGSENTDRRGDMLIDVIEDFDLVCLNTGEPTYLHFNGTMSILNLSITSANLATFAKWEVLEETLGSDLFVTSIELSFSPVCFSDGTP